MEGEPDPQRRRVEEGPPSWAIPLLSALPQLSDEVRQLKEKFAALSVSASQSQSPAYPSVVTARALADLSTDPRTPPFAVPFLIALATNFPSSSDEAHLAPVQQAYDHALQLRQEPAGGSQGPSAGPSAGRSRSPSRFRMVGGKMMYVTNRGIMYDISKPPPKPCRGCGGAHWSWHCPYETSRFPPPPGQQNSHMGVGPAVQSSSQ